MSNISETMQEINRVSNIKTMSSREIAKLTGKEHKHVLRDIENILKDAEIDQSKFGHIYSHCANPLKRRVTDDLGRYV